MALSGTVGSGDKVLTSQYNNLRSDVLDPTLGHTHGGGTDEGAPVVNLQHGLDSAKPASPDVGDVWIATDTEVVYRCFTAGQWSGTFAFDDSGAKFDTAAYPPDPTKNWLYLKFPPNGALEIATSETPMHPFILMEADSTQPDVGTANYVSLYAPGLKRRNVEAEPVTTHLTPAMNETVWGGTNGSTWSDGDVGTIKWAENFLGDTSYVVRWALASVWIKDSGAEDTECFIEFRRSATDDIASAVYAPPANDRWASGLIFVETDDNGYSYCAVHGSGTNTVTLKLFLVAWGGYG